MIPVRSITTASTAFPEMTDFDRFFNADSDLFQSQTQPDLNIGAPLRPARSALSAAAKESIENTSSAHTGKNIGE